MSYKFTNWDHPGQGEYPAGELEWFKLLGELVQPNTVAIDIGAYTGDTTLPIAEGCATCYAFEPNPRAYLALINNIDQNPHLDIRAYCMAVSCRTGPISLFYGEMNGGAFYAPHVGHSKEMRSWAVTLPSFLDSVGESRQISLIKIDTEGHDLDVLKSLDALLHVHKPVLAVEEFPYQTDEYKRELNEWLLKRGYYVRRHGIDLICTPSVGE